MVALLAQDATLYSDGGGKAKAAQKPIHGALSIARFLIGIRRQAAEMGFELRPTLVNGRTGFVTLVEGRPYSVFSLDTEPGRIRGIYVVVNPDKLARVEV
jgi:RNA polymerase sigma-70 factor, ECF subfamily